MKQRQVRLFVLIGVSPFYYWKQITLSPFGTIYEMGFSKGADLKHSEWNTLFGGLCVFGSDKAESFLFWHDPPIPKRILVS
jgi:hypothetical protein